MQFRPAHAIVPLAVVAAIVVPLAALQSPPEGMGQTVPPGGGPVTTPQPTVPCTPVNACGRGAPQQVAFPWAYIQRYCNGSAVPTPPGQTTFALVYGNGILAPTTASFTGTLLVNGAVVPSAPLITLIAGERDVRIRQGVVNNTDIFTVQLTATDPTGALLAFGDGKTTKVLSASGACPDVVPTPLLPTPSISIPPIGSLPVTPTGPPNITATVPRGPFGFPPAL